MSNKTLILISHRMALLQLVDRLIVLDQGRLILDGQKNDILEKLGVPKNKLEKPTQPKTKSPTSNSKPIKRISAVIRRKRK